MSVSEFVTCKAFLVLSGRFKGSKLRTDGGSEILVLGSPRYRNLDALHLVWLEHEGLRRGFWVTADRIGSSKEDTQRHAVVCLLSRYKKHEVLFCDPCISPAWDTRFIGGRSDGLRFTGGGDSAPEKALVTSLGDLYLLKCVAGVPIYQEAHSARTGENLLSLLEDGYTVRQYKPYADAPPTTVLPEAADGEGTAEHP